MKLLLHSIAFMGLVATSAVIAMDAPTPSKKRSLDSLLSAEKNEDTSSCESLSNSAKISRLEGHTKTLAMFLTMLSESFEANKTSYDHAVDVLGCAIIGQKRLTTKVAEGSDFELAIRLLEKHYKGKDQAAIAKSLFNSLERQGCTSSWVKLFRTTSKEL